MSKSAQLKEQRRNEIREQFLQDLYSEEGSEEGISIFDEKVHKPKRFRTEITVHINKAKPMTLPKVSTAKVEVKAAKPGKPKTFKSSVNINLRKPQKPIPAPPSLTTTGKPIPLPRTKEPRAKPIPTPRTRKPLKQPKEKELQPSVITPEEHEIDAFGTDLQKPFYRKIETAVDGAAVTHMISPTYLDSQNQLTASGQVVREILEKELSRMGGVKYTETLKVRMIREIGEGKTQKDSVHFKSKSGTLTNHEDIEATATFNHQIILQRIEAFQNLGSNWRILNIEAHYLNAALYKPLKGSSYMELPEDIRNPKSGLLNMKNGEDTMYFMWCHVRHLRPKKDRATTITKKDEDFSNTLNYDGIDFPVKVSDIGKIERMNEINVTVIGYKGKKQFYPIRISKGEYEDSMELLLLGDGKGNLHYVLIKDVNRLLFSVTKNKDKKHFCLHCFHSSSSKELLEKHKETCIQVNGVQATKLPKEGTKIKFKNYKHQVPAPFIIYADFESILVPDNERKMDETSDESHTTRYQTHQACSYGLKRVCYYDDWHSGEYNSYIGKDAARNFIQAVLDEAKVCNRIMKTQFNKPMKLTEEEEYQNADYCHICTKWLDDNDAVRDHCHVTGKFRGAAHSKCNLNYKLTYKIPVVFHNLRGYDSHLIMQEIGGFGLEVNVIPNNMEKYISFSLGKQLVFIDSIQLTWETKQGEWYWK
jgi:hypothetical protein